MGRLIKCCAVLTAILFVAQIALLNVARQTYDDPLAPYHEAMLAQWVDAVKDHPCSLYAGNGRGVSAGSCQFDTDEDGFGRVAVVEVNHTITELGFNVQPGRLSLGDLVLCWGKPDHSEFIAVMGPTQVLNMRWGSQVSSLITVPFGETPSYFLSVRYLALQPQGLSCRSVE